MKGFPGKRGAAVGFAAVRFRHKHLAGANPEPCRLDVGLAMGPALKRWVTGTLDRSDESSPSLMRPVRTDGKTAPTLELHDVRLAAVTVPAVDTTSSDRVYLRVELDPDTVIRHPADQNARVPAGADVSVHPIVASATTRLLATKPLSGVALGARTFTAPPAGRDQSGALPVLGDLALRVPEAQTRAITTMDDFLQSFLVGGRDARADENDADLSLSDGGSLRLVVTFGQVGVYQGDLAPRADGTRGYALYVESAQAA